MAYVVCCCFLGVVPYPPAPRSEAINDGGVASLTPWQRTLPVKERAAAPSSRAVLTVDLDQGIAVDHECEPASSANR